LNVVKKISANEFEAKFDAGEDISEFVDWSKMRRPGRETRCVNVDFPGWVVEALDREAGRLGDRGRRWSSCGSPSGSAEPGKSSGLSLRLPPAWRRARREGEGLTAGIVGEAVEIEGARAKRPEDFEPEKRRPNP
jgi:hypothetical protein